jgi:hypothetical protein
LARQGWEDGSVRAASNLALGIVVGWRSEVAATKVKEWALARTATKGKKEENMAIVQLVEFFSGKGAWMTCKSCLLLIMFRYYIIYMIKTHHSFITVVSIEKRRISLSATLLTGWIPVTLLARESTRRVTRVAVDVGRDHLLVIAGDFWQNLIQTALNNTWGQFEDHFKYIN